MTSFFMVTLCLPLLRDPCDGGVRAHDCDCCRCQLSDWNNLHSSGGRRGGRREEREERQDH